MSYVLAIKRNDTLTMPPGEQRADALIAALPARAWQRLSAGAGAHGPREYHWARVPVRAAWRQVAEDRVEQEPSSTRLGQVGVAGL